MAYLFSAKAEAYKDDGNSEFQKKKYRIAVDNYTEGIKCQCPDRNLNAILYTNRAAAQYHLGNLSDKEFVNFFPFFIASMLLFVAVKKFDTKFF